MNVRYQRISWCFTSIKFSVINMQRCGGRERGNRDKSRYSYEDPELNHEKYCGCVDVDKRYTGWAVWPAHTTRLVTE
jgi:hypothetical protein